MDTMVSLKEFVNQRKAINAKIVKQMVGGATLEEYCTNDQLGEKGRKFCKVIRTACSRENAFTKDECRVAIAEWNTLTVENVKNIVKEIDVKSLVDIGKFLKMLTEVEDETFVMEHDSFVNWYQNSLSEADRAGKTLSIEAKNNIRKMEAIWKKLSDDLKQQEEKSLQASLERARQDLGTQLEEEIRKAQGEGEGDLQPVVDKLKQQVIDTGMELALAQKKVVELQENQANMTLISRKKKEADNLEKKLKGLKKKMNQMSNLSNPKNVYMALNR